MSEMEYLQILLKRAQILSDPTLTLKQAYEKIEIETGRPIFWIPPEAFEEEILVDYDLCQEDNEVQDKYEYLDYDMPQADVDYTPDGW